MKNIKYIKLFAMFLAVLLAFMTAGCSEEKELTVSTASASYNVKPEISNNANESENRLTISYASWDIDKYMASAGTDEVFKTISQKLNIEIKPIGLTYDNYAQKIQMWAASRQLPDIFSIDAVGTQSYRNWIDQGIIKPLPVNLNKYPNLQKYLDTTDIKELQENGRYYCIPRKNYPSLDYNAVDRLVEYRWDLAKTAGITKEPETWEEFKAMLKAIVEKDPEGKSIAGFSCANIKQISGFFWLYSNPAAASDGSGTDYKWIKEGGRFIPAVFSQNALPSLENMRDMGNQGLLDEGMSLTKGDQGYDKFADGKIAALLHGGGYTTTNQKILIDRWKRINPNKNYSDCVKVLKPLKNQNGDAYHAAFKTYWSESYFNSSMPDEKLDRILKLYNFLVSEEGHDFLRYGIEGVDYEKEGNRYNILLDPKTSVTDKYKAMPVFKEMAEWDQGFPYDNPEVPILDTEIRQAAVDYMKYIKQNTKTPEFVIKLTYLSTPAKDKFSILDYEDLLRVLLSKEPVAEAWNGILDEYRERGLEQVIEQVNEKVKETGIN